MGEATIRPWTVIVLGRWNKSILTPMGISRILLNRPEVSQIQIEVPVNVAGPPRIKDGGIVVMVDDDRLVIEVENDNFESLGKGLEVAARAVGGLEKTPVTAAGVTLHFDIAPLATTAPVVTNKQWDQLLGDDGYEIERHHAGRTIGWNSAKIVCVTDRANDNTGSVMINFELRSEKSEELGGWLKIPPSAFQAHSEKLLNILRQGGIS